MGSSMGAVCSSREATDGERRMLCAHMLQLIGGA